MAKRKGSSGKGGSHQAAVNQKAAVNGGSAPQAEAAATVAATPAATPNPKASAATISRKEMLREAAIKKRKQQNMLFTAGAVLVVALIAVASYFYYQSQQPVVGETTFPTQGNLHIPLGSVSPTEYNSTPPTTGPHFENLASWGVHADNVRYEHLIHNLEDRGVVVYYQCETDCPELVAELESILEPYIASGRHIVLARNNPAWVENGQQLHQDMGAPIALTAWRKLLLMDEVDAETIQKFIEKYEGIDHHRG
jgi:hypothetical protein